jgi:hypothetical protein
MLIKAGAAVRVLGEDPDRGLCGSGQNAIFGEVVEQTKRGQSAMWKVRFDNDETHELAASWIELKLWARPVESEEEDDHNDEEEESSDQASSKADDDEDEDDDEEEAGENADGTAAIARSSTQASSANMEQASGAPKRQVTCSNCGALGHNRTSCKE